MKLKEKYGIPYIVAVRNTDVNIFFKQMIHLRKLGVQILKKQKKLFFYRNLIEMKLLENYVPENLREKYQ